MLSTTSKSSELPFKCRMVCVSLVGGTLLIAIIYLFYYFGFISIEAAMWAGGGVFIAAAIYETVLMSLITRYMLGRVNNNRKDSETRSDNHLLSL
jgi:biotin transporter BioY